jgi:glycerol kinase
MHILAIDQGTSSTKALLVDEAGAVTGAAAEPVRPRYLADGGVEQDPAELLSSVIVSGKRAIAAAGVSPDVVAIANQGETVLAWDPAAGTPLSPAIGWQDRRAQQVCAELATHRDWIAQRSGLVLDPYFSAPKMTWLRRSRTGDGVVTTTDSWLVWQLTGEFVTDAATASRSLLTALDSADWDNELIRLFGLEREQFPRIVGCDEIVGTTTAFGRPTPVGGLIVDQQAALLGERCLAVGAAKATFGTGAFLLVNAGRTAVRPTSGLAASVAWRVRGNTQYCLDGQVYAAAAAVNWLRELGLISSAADLDRVVAPDSDGTLCVPALAGLAAPWWRPDATASLTGMTLATTAGHIALAVMLGIAAQLAELSDMVAADLGSPLTVLRADGGLSQSAALMQATADLTQLPVEVYPSPDATALGAAALGRLAADPALDLSAAIASWTPSATYLPRWSADRAAEYRARWRSALTATLPGGPR